MNLQPQTGVAFICMRHKVLGNIPGLRRRFHMHSITPCRYLTEDIWALIYQLRQTRGWEVRVQIADSEAVRVA